MADEQIVEEVVDDDEKVTEEDLRDLKYGTEEVETPNGEDESSEDTESEEGSEEAGETDGQTEGEAETEEETQPDFVKQFPNIKGETPEEYAKNLEAAYQNSTAEALRLKGLAEAPKTEESSAPAEVDISSPLELYAKQQMDKEITDAYSEFSKRFPQVADQTEYSRFTQEVSVLSNTILQSQKRLASPTELYNKAAVILGWEPEAPSKAEKVATAAKDSAGTSKTSSASKPSSKSKVTEAMILTNRKMYPGKSDAEIVKELEPFIQ